MVSTYCEENNDNSVYIIPWKRGIAVVYEKKVVLLIRQEQNLLMCNDDNIIKGSHRLELHIYLQTLMSFSTDKNICQYVTKLLILVSQCIESAMTGFRENMLVSPEAVYVPCWMCYAQKDNDKIKHASSSRYYLCKDDRRMCCFKLNECVRYAFNEKSLVCPFHGEISIEEAMPDYVRVLIAVVFLIICNFYAGIQ